VDSLRLIELAEAHVEGHIDLDFLDEAVVIVIKARPPPVKFTMPTTSGTSIEPAI